MICQATRADGQLCPREAVEGKSLCNVHERAGKLTFAPWEGDYRPHLREAVLAARAVNANLRTLVSEKNIHTYSGGPRFPNAKVAGEFLLEFIAQVEDILVEWERAVR